MLKRKCETQILIEPTANESKVFALDLGGPLEQAGLGWFLALSQSLGKNQLA